VSVVERRRAVVSFTVVVILIVHGGVGVIGGASRDRRAVRMDP
jgi:hypothetical protein